MPAAGCRFRGAGRAVPGNIRSDGEKAENRRYADRRLVLQTKEYKKPTKAPRRRLGRQLLRLRAAPKALPGKGGRSKWTGAAINDAGFAPPELPSRAVSKCTGTSTAHARKCAFFLADMVESRQVE